MYEQELEHLKEFERLMVRAPRAPSALYPLWHVAGFALGAATALMGSKAAMACTVAVEEVIDEHYRDQAETLGADEKPLQADDREIPRRRSSTTATPASPTARAGGGVSGADGGDQSRPRACNLAGRADLSLKVDPQQHRTDGLGEADA